MIQKKNKIVLPTIIREHLSGSWGTVFTLNKTTRSYKKDEVVIEEGSKLSEIGFVVTGKLKIVAKLKDEAEFIPRLVTSGEIIGLRAFGNGTIFPAAAITLTDCEIEFIPLSLFEDMLMANPAFCYYFMSLIAKELRNSEKQMRDFSRMEMRERVALTILNNLKSFGYSKEQKKVLSFTLSRKDYSSIVGTTYETVVRMLSELEKMKLVRLEKKDIRILNESGLRRLVNKKLVSHKK